MSLIIAKPTNAKDSATDAIDPKEAGDADFVNSEEFKKAGKIVESIWLLIDRNKNAEAAKLFKENEAFIRKYSHAPNHIIEGLKRSAQDAATDAIDPKELGRREFAIASKINNDLAELHFVLQVGANYAYELKSKNPNEYKLESELLGRDLFSYYMNALNNHKQGAALIRNAIGHR